MVAKGILDVAVDEQNRLISTPAYMLEATPWEIFQGVGKMVETTVEMANRSAPKMKAV